VKFIHFLEDEQQTDLVAQCRWLVLRLQLVIGLWTREVINFVISKHINSFRAKWKEWNIIWYHTSSYWLKNCHWIETHREESYASWYQQPTASHPACLPLLWKKRGNYVIISNDSLTMSLPWIGKLQSLKTCQEVYKNSWQNCSTLKPVVKTECSWCHISNWWKNWLQDCFCHQKNVHAQ